jgi:phosphonate transport system substrate-binding protein
MPRFFLNQQGIDPESFLGKVCYSNGPGHTVELVRDDTVVLGVANSNTFDMLLRSQDLNPEDVRILQWTLPYADYFWVIRRNFHPEMSNRIWDAFLALDPGKQGHFAILQALRTDHSLPAGKHDFDILQSVMDQLHLFEERVQ